MGTTDNGVMLYDNGKFLNIGYDLTTASAMTSYVYNGDVKVAVGNLCGGLYLFSQNDYKKHADQGYKTIQGCNVNAPITTMISFGVQNGEVSGFNPTTGKPIPELSDTKVVIGYDCNSDNCGAVMMYSMKESKLTTLHDNSWDRTVTCLKYFEYMGVPYIAVGLSNREGEGGAAALYNMQSEKWAMLGNAWTSKILTLNVIGDYLLAGTSNGALNGASISKIHEMQSSGNEDFNGFNWQNFIAPNWTKNPGYQKCNYPELASPEYIYQTIFISQLNQYSDRYENNVSPAYIGFSDGHIMECNFNLSDEQGYSPIMNQDDSVVDNSQHHTEL